MCRSTSPRGIFTKRSDVCWSASSWDPSSTSRGAVLYVPPEMKSLPILHRRNVLATVMVMLTGLGIASGESPHAQQIKAFLKMHADAVPLIVIKDGKGDFSNWERFEAEVIDGDHVHVPKTSPRTKQEFGDFKLILEFKMDPGANSGIYLRGLGELQVLENTAKQYAKLDPRQYHGSAYGLAPAKRGHLKPVGEWNYQEVVVRGTTIVVHLNGTKILDTDLSKITHTMKDKEYSVSKKQKGALVLGGHASGVFYRNMYVAELEANTGH